MSFLSLKNLISEVTQSTPDQVDAWSKAWRVAAENGGQESLIEFIARECGRSEETFLQELAKRLNWPFLELRSLSIPTEARNRISTKVAFQYSVIPANVVDGQLQVAVSNPFDPSMINSVQFDARSPVQFALAPRAEID